MDVYIQGTIGRVLKDLTRSTKVEERSIFRIYIIKGAYVRRLFLKVSPTSLMRTPCAPTIDRELILGTKSCNLTIRRHTRLLVLSSVTKCIKTSAYKYLLTVERSRRRRVSLVVSVKAGNRVILKGERQVIAYSATTKPTFRNTGVRYKVHNTTKTISRIGCRSKG